jgi:hypothetical protein
MICVARAEGPLGNCLTGFLVICDRFSTDAGRQEHFALNSRTDGGDQLFARILLQNITPNSIVERRLHYFRANTSNLNGEFVR